MNLKAGLALLLLGACASEKRGEIEADLLPRADADLLAENYSAAAFKYEKFLRLNPETARRAWLHSQIGVCRNGSRDYEGALRAFDLALAAAPDAVLQIRIRYRRAIANNFLDRPEPALADLEEVRDAPSEKRGEAVKTAEFLRILGGTEIRAGFWVRGQRTIKDLIEKFPTSPEAETVRPYLALKAFTVQLAQCADDKAASAKVAELRSKGVSARPISWPDRTGVVVVTGEFARYPDAVRERVRLREKGLDAFILP